MKTLLALPWVGEFGHELFGWQGYLRKYSQDYDKVVVACRPGRELLYADFADEIISYDPGGTETDMHRLRDAKEDLSDFYINRGYSGIVLRAIGVYNPLLQKFIKFGTASTKEHRDIVIHARSTSKCGTSYRNWGYDLWERFVRAFPDKRIACIGTVSESLGISQTENLRGISLEWLADILASSTVCVGPSSGPMHFASLCGCPHVVWADNRVAVIDNRKRYEVEWNPFRTPVAFIEDWQPPVELVIKKVEEMLRAHTDKK